GDRRARARRARGHRPHAAGRCAGPDRAPAGPLRRGRPGRRAAGRRPRRRPPFPGPSPPRPRPGRLPLPARRTLPALRPRRRCGASRDDARDRDGGPRVRHGGAHVGQALAIAPSRCGCDRVRAGRVARRRGTRGGDRSVPARGGWRMSAGSTQVRAVGSGTAVRPGSAVPPGRGAPLGRAARVGGLVLVDGTSGAGKTTAARDLAAGTGARVLHMDDLYAGWEGMAHATATLERILTERAAGRTPRWRRWDWHASAWGEEDSIAPDVPLIVEGCGSVTAVTAGFADRVLWLDAPE